MKRMMSVLMAAVVGLACVVRADALDEAKARRKARREQVERIIKAGEASEGADGFLSAKAGLASDKAAVVQAENADRRIGYASIAAGNGKTVEEVGRLAAAALSKSRGAKKDE